METPADTVVKRLRAEQATAPVAHHGEGPVWDEATGSLRFVDLLRGDVLSLDPSSEHISRTPVSSIAACLAPRADGGLVVATERGFALLDPNGRRDILPDLWDDPGVRMNDGGCDRHGRFFCGSMAYDETSGRGSLHRLDPDRSVHLVLEGVTISNGIGWSPAGDITYYIDTPTRAVDAFTYEASTGSLSHRRTAIDLTDLIGMPDGLTVDAAGGVWVALWGGSAIHRYLHGSLTAVVEVPVSQVTSCAFGGDALDTLFITTSAQGLVDPEPAAGAVFVAEPGVRGLPTATYGG